MEENPIFVEETSSDVMSITMDHSEKFFEESLEKQKITETSTTTQCKCHRHPKPNINIQTEAQLQEKIKEIKKELSINWKDLSSYRRRKTSVDDDRMSAKGIGIVGAGILCAFVSIIIFMDLKTLAHQGSLLWRRALGKKCPSSK
ncbi:uncharacterized protein LOC134243149 [Saccostrea cucullata]|uniref:uncharacterized protein LOC134243149 n=1 Tax=Saccostrea cuccullata TaxID=36930 RepID=UPI002ED26E9D